MSGDPKIASFLHHKNLKEQTESSEGIITSGGDPPDGSGNLEERMIAVEKDLSILHNDMSWLKWILGIGFGLITSAFIYQANTISSTWNDRTEVIRQESITRTEALRVQLKEESLETKSILNELLRRTSSKK